MRVASLPASIPTDHYNLYRAATAGTVDQHPELESKSSCPSNTAVHVLARGPSGGKALVSHTVLHVATGP
jgi:hypothetical protein